MKRFLALVSVPFLLFSAAGTLSAQPAPSSPPWTLDQYTFTNSAGHTVPFAVAFPYNRPSSLVVDPSISAADLAALWAHVNAAGALPYRAPTTVTTIAGAVSMNFETQVYRVPTPFGITASTTLTTVPALQGVVQTAGHYTFRAVLYINCGAGGAKVDFGGTSSTSNVVAQVKGFGGTSILFGSQITSYLSGPAGVSSASLTQIILDGEVDVGNGGTFVIQFAQNASNASVSTILSGSTLTLTQIP